MVDPVTIYLMCFTLKYYACNSNIFKCTLFSTLSTLCRIKTGILVLRTAINKSLCSKLYERDKGSTSV